ncbi:MAG: hypothetical protein Kow00121_25430 [Elainellaceae cyanobacterium]
MYRLYVIKFYVIFNSQEYMKITLSVNHGIEARYAMCDDLNNQQGGQKLDG